MAPCVRQSHTVTIQRPLAEVFAYTEDEENAPKWAQGIVRLEILQDVPEGPGTSYRMIVREGGSENAYEGEVLVWDENERTVNRIHRDGMVMEMERRYQARGGRATDLTMTVDVQIAGWAKLMAPLMWLMNRHFLNKQAGKLKELVESQGGS